MNLTMKNLESCFEDAKRLGYEYVAVRIDMRGFKEPEIIINKKENFDDKLDYYKNTYDDNLVLKSFNGIRITGFIYADTFEDIEDDLLYGTE